jgi:hypothetical protein
MLLMKIGTFVIALYPGMSDVSRRRVGIVSGLGSRAAKSGDDPIYPVD